MGCNLWLSNRLRGALRERTALYRDGREMEIETGREIARGSENKHQATETELATSAQNLGCDLRSTGNLGECVWGEGLPRKRPTPWRGCYTEFNPRLKGN